MATGKPIKQKPDPTSSSAHPAAPQRDQNDTQPKQFTLSFSLDKKFTSKLPLLAITAVVFLLAMVMFARANISLSDLFDIGRLVINMEKAYSISMVLFIVLFSISLALALLFGLKLERGQAVLLLPVLFLPLIIASLLFPKYLLAFIAFAFSCGLTSVFATTVEKLNFSGIWNGIGKALFVLAFLAVIFTLVKVGGSKDAYFDEFLGGVVDFMPAIQGHVQGAVATSVENIDIDTDELAASLAKEMSASNGQSGGGGLFTREFVAQMVPSQYDAYRATILDSASWKTPAEKDYASQQTPTWSTLGDSKKTALIDSVYAKIQASSSQQINSGSGSDLNTQLSKQLAAIWPKFRQQLAAQIRSSQPAQSASTMDVKDLREKVLKIDFMRTFYNYFEFFIALMVLSFVSVVNFLLRILSTLIAYGVAKLL